MTCLPVKAVAEPLVGIAVPGRRRLDHGQTKGFQGRLPRRSTGRVPLGSQGDRSAACGGAKSLKKMASPTRFELVLPP